VISNEQPKTSTETANNFKKQTSIIATTY